MPNIPGTLVGVPGALGPSGQLLRPTAHIPPANPNAGQPQQGTRGKKSDQRFRSFAERYVVARAHVFRADYDGHLEDQFLCVMDAKRVYNLIEQVGRHIEPEDGTF